MCIRDSLSGLNRLDDRAVDGALGNLGLVRDDAPVHDHLLDGPLAVSYTHLFAVGFFQNPYILMLTPLPVGLATFLSSMAWQNIFIPVLCFVVGVVCFWPFVRMYDKQCLADEQAANEQAAA